jgi:anthranilate synthase component 1
MNVSPPPAKFAESYNAGKPQVVWARLVGDLETPVSAFMKVAAGQANSFLLESVEGGAVRGRYSVIGINPDLIWKAEGGKAYICDNPQLADVQLEPQSEPVLASLRSLLAASRIDLPEELPPMAAGVFGFMGYDTVRLVEDLPDINPDPLQLPDGVLLRPSVILIFDAVKDEITVVTPVWHDPDTSAASARSRAMDRINLVMDRLEAPLSHSAKSASTEAAPPVSTSNTTPEQYRQMVARAKEYIAAGDIFQVVLSQRFEADFDLEPFALYRALRRTNPSPYLYFLNFGEFAIAGSSPEILVKLETGKVTLRPIAGTRPRGKDRAEDEALEKELLADEKERAEHLMLLDLGRNDVGRVAEIGTVEVTDSFFIERYSHVMHIVSNVEGKLADGHDAIDALMAGFPAGTVSGAPKVRAMQIIDELEREKRGIYAGCVGYFSANGDMDTCIVLRTAIVRDGKMYVQAGAGIVADSIPESEQSECENKSRALFHAAEEAVNFATGIRHGC